MPTKKGFLEEVQGEASKENQSMALMKTNDKKVIVEKVPPLL